MAKKRQQRMEVRREAGRKSSLDCLTHRNRCVNSEYMAELCCPCILTSTIENNSYRPGRFFFFTVSGKEFFSVMLSYFPWPSSIPRTDDCIKKKKKILAWLRENKKSGRKIIETNMMRFGVFLVFFFRMVTNAKQKNKTKLKHFNYLSLCWGLNA